MILRAVVNICKFIITAIAKIFAWLLINLGLWMPAVYSIVFFIVCAITSTPLSSLKNLFFAGLVITTIVSVWLTLSAGRNKKSKKKPKAAAASPAYMSKLKEKEANIEYRRREPKPVQVQAEEAHAGKSYLSKKHQEEERALREGRYPGEDYSQPYEEPAPSGVRDYAFQSYKKRPFEEPYAAQADPAYDGYDNERYDSRDHGFRPGGMQQSTAFSGLQEREAPAFEGYHSKRPEREYREKTFEGHMHEVSDQGQKNGHDYKSNYEKLKNSYFSQIPLQKKEQAKNPYGFEDYHGARSRHDDVGSERAESPYDYKQSDYRETEQSDYSRAEQPYQEARKDPRGFLPYRKPGFHEPRATQPDARPRQSRPPQRETPKVFATRRDSALLIYEYSDRLEYHRQTQWGLRLEHVEYKTNPFTA